MSPQTFIFIGRSGCGKGTQSELLSKALIEKNAAFGAFHLETGKRFREFIKGDGYTNGLSREAIDTGSLQPEFLAIWNWGGQLVEKLSNEDHLIIDGAPRRKYEAEILHEALKFYDRNHAFVFLIDVSAEWSTERLKARALKEGRKDDNGEAIKRRMAWYERDVLPAIHFFENHKDYSFFAINGEQPIAKVQADIASKISFLTEK